MMLQKDLANKIARNAKRVKYDGVVYDSITALAKALKMSDFTLRQHIYSKRLLNGKPIEVLGTATNYKNKKNYLG